MENKVINPQGVVCGHCGYPYNKGRRYCKVCGNDLRENKRAGQRPLTNNKVVAYTLIAISIIVAFIGIFGAVSYQCSTFDGHQYFTPNSIAWWFKDGWDYLSSLSGQATFATEATKFGLGFGTYLLALIGAILVTIVFLMALSRRLNGKESRFCVHKCFCFLAAFILPYVFTVTFFGDYRLFFDLEGKAFSYVETTSWGIILCFISIVVAFFATCFARDRSTRKENKAFCLRQIATLLVLLTIGASFCCAVVFKGSNGITMEGSIYWIIYEFMSDADIPTQVGALAISSLLVLFTAFLVGLLVLFSRKNNFKIIYISILLGLAVTGSVLAYLSSVGYNEYIGNVATVGYGHSFIAADVLLGFALLFAISAKVREESF